MYKRQLFYVPPTLPTAFDDDGRFDEDRSRAPAEELRRLFGPGVDGALATIESEREKVRAGERSEILDALISRDWNDLLGPFTVDPGGLERPPPR